MALPLERAPRIATCHWSLVTRGTPASWQAPREGRVTNYQGHMRWIWIDKFVEFTPRTSATAVKNVTLAEEHLHDLYPAFPIMPHTLMIEGFAQTSGILVGEARNFAEKVILAKVSRATFHRIVRPGET